MTNKEIAWQVDNEGMDYTFRNHLDIDDVKDKKLKKLIEMYIVLANEIEDMLPEIED